MDLPYSAGSQFVFCKQQVRRGQIIQLLKKKYQWWSCPY